MQALAMPTRLYDLLPIGLLIGAILALAGLAQRNELVILRVSGVSGMQLLGMLWVVTMPLMIGATVLSEYGHADGAEINSGEANLLFRGKRGRQPPGKRLLVQGAHGRRRHRARINIAKLKARRPGGRHHPVRIPARTWTLIALVHRAHRACFAHGNLILKNVVENRTWHDAVRSAGQRHARPRSRPSKWSSSRNAS